MMKMMKLSLALAIMIVLLGGCPIGDHFDFITGPKPVVTVSVNEAAAGDFVDVTVKTRWFLRETSQSPEQRIYIEIGACFEVLSSEEVGGFCSSTLPLPNGLKLAEGDTPFTDYGELVIKRGESVDLEHHFRLTADQPAEVVITGILTRRSIEDDQRGIEIGQQALVKFK
ncbi:MAG: hypothetical protein M3511_09305 [Deinococcota bacterium]|nr:hypothetical protein [Deinococcota bacterium]